MANRHSHKKLRTETLELMATTGLSYQKARQQLLADESRIMRNTAPARESDAAEQVDLIEATYFGIPVHIATAASMSTMQMVMVSRDGSVPGAVRPLRGPVHRSPLRS